MMGGRRGIRPSCGFRTGILSHRAGDPGSTRASLTTGGAPLQCRRIRPASRRAALDLTYNPYAPQVRRDPYPVYRELRERDPVHFNPYAGIWFLTRHDHCSSVLRDPRCSAALGQGLRRGDRELPRSMLNTDPPEHARLRAPVNRAFTLRRIERLRPHVERLVDELLAPLAERREIEVVSEIAGPLAAGALVRLLGIPAADRDGFRRLVRAAGPVLDPLAAPAARDRGAAAAEALDGYFDVLLSERQRSPQDDLLSDLLEAGGARSLDRTEILTMCNLFVIGGYEPTVHLIGNGLLALLRHPAELRRLRESPRLAGSAVEELIRYDSPIQFTARVATRDLNLDGTAIRDGQAVVALFGAANRDPAVFPEPDRLDLGRTPNPHLGFGGGVHFCLGAPLARLAGRIALGELARRFPGLEAARDRHEWRDSAVPRGLAELRVRA